MRGQVPPLDVSLNGIWPIMRFSAAEYRRCEMQGSQALERWSIHTELEEDFLLAIVGDICLMIPRTRPGDAPPRSVKFALQYSLGLRDILLHSIKDSVAENALCDDRLEEAAEDRQPETRTDATQLGVIGQRLIAVVSSPARRTPAAPRQVVVDLLHELTPGADTGEEHDALQAEEDLGVDGRSTTGGVAM